MSKHPGTSGLMPVKGSGCGVRPDPAALTDDIGFDFSAAAGLLSDEKSESDKVSNPANKPSTAQAKQK